MTHKTVAREAAFFLGLYSPVTSYPVSIAGSVFSPPLLMLLIKDFSEMSAWISTQKVAVTSQALYTFRNSHFTLFRMLSLKQGSVLNLKICLLALWQYFKIYSYILVTKIILCTMYCIIFSLYFGSKIHMLLSTIVIIFSIFISYIYIIS
jgi:hypothetical protein